MTRHKTVKADKVVRLIAVMVPVAEMGYTQVLPVASASWICNSMHGSAYWVQDAKTLQSCLCPAVGVGKIFTNYLWVEASGIQLKSAIA